MNSDPVPTGPKRMLEGFSLPRGNSEPCPIPDRKPRNLIEGPGMSGMIRKVINQLYSDESYFKVTCGSLEGRLIWQKFVCPGINVRCIRVDGSPHHELITPKEMVREAGKQTLKDWKRAIRINSKMLR